MQSFIIYKTVVLLSTALSIFEKYLEYIHVLCIQHF